MGYRDVSRLIQTDQMLCDVWPQLVLSEPTDAEREDARLARDGVLKFEGHQIKVGRKVWRCPPSFGQFPA